MARVNQATFTIRFDGTPPAISVYVLHASGEPVTLTASDLAAILTPAQRNGTGTVLTAIHNEVEARLKARLTAERAALDADP